MAHLVRCSGCGAQNRIERFRLDALPRRGRCGIFLPEPNWIKASRTARRHWAWIVLVAAVGGGWWASTVPSTSRQSAMPRGTTCQAVPVTAGVYRSYRHGEAIAPFRIVTPPGENYFIKLVETSSGSPVVTLFARGGIPLEVEVPLGSYTLRYAYGRTWCGEQALFGEETRYGEAQSTFTFSAQGGQISGYTVELTPRVHGNLRTRSIAGSSF